MAEARTALAVADHDQRGEAKALAALHGLGDAVDMNQLFDQLFATLVLVVATTIIATAAATAITTAPAIVATTATTAAAPTTLAFRRCAGGCRFGGACFVLNLVSHLELQSGFARGIG
jgi:hypothetical protein